MKSLALLLPVLASACLGPTLDPGSAQDKDVQTALRGLDKIFAERGLYNNLQQDLNDFGWRLDFYEYGSPLPCPSGAIACTSVSADEWLTVSLWESAGVFPECPRIPSVFAHELYHAALYMRSGDGDAGHTNEAVNWLLIDSQIYLIDICKE